MSDPARFVNDNGRTRWQPRLENGKRLWRSQGRTQWAYCRPRSGLDWWDEALYRSRARAIRVAKRRDRRQRNSSWREAGE